METWNLWRTLTGLLTVLLWSFCPIQAQVTLAPFRAPVNIREDTTVETELVWVDCTNPTDVCICNLMHTAPGAVPFNVWTKGGLSDFHVYYVGVANGSPLSYRQKPSYFLTIECTNSTRQDNQRTILEVDVLQNHPPTFQKPRDDVKVDVRTAKAGDNVYTASATDAQKDPITYSIKSVSPPVKFFDINPRTGGITLASDLFTATDSLIVITVEADDGFHSVRNNFQLDVTLENLNHRPEIRNLPQTMRIPEDTIAGSTIINLDIFDPDPLLSTLPVSCTVVPPSENFRFKYMPGSRKLTLATSIDFERTSQYVISCEVSDGYLTSENDVLNLIVENINEPPEFDEIAYYCDMDESDIGVSSCNIGAVITDPEGDKIPVVSFLRGNNSDRFRFDRSTSQITFAKKYDVDQLHYPTSVTLQLQAEDIYGETSKVPVYFKIRDVNDNKCDFGVTSTFSYSIDQGTQPKTLGTLIASDADLTSPNNMVTYEMVSAVPPEAWKYITMHSDGTYAYIGLIPPQNHGRSYNLVVKCKDGGSPQLSSEATIVLTYLTTTTTTTSTTTTTTPTTTITTATTTTTEKFDVWDVDAFVGVFAAMMALLALALIAGAYLLCQACCGACGAWGLCPAGACGAGGGGGGGGCKDFCCPKPKPKVDPGDDYFNTDVRTNSNYRDTHWKTGDNFESGTLYNPDGALPGSPLHEGPVRLTGPPPRGLKL